MASSTSFSESVAQFAATLFFVITFSCFGNCYSVSNSWNNDDKRDNWYNVPIHGSFNVEFKFEIGPGKVECFYQPMLNGTQLFISYEVLTGGDRNIDFFLRDERLEILVHKSWKTEGIFDQIIQTRGIYELCFDNSYSRFASKLVFFYMSAFVPEHWDEYLKELADIHKTVANFSVSLQTLQQNIKNAVIHQSSSRMYVMLDYYTIMGNNKYVQYWSILQCIVIISASCLQVFFLRRLFHSKNVTPTMKPRA